MVDTYVFIELALVISSVGLGILIFCTLALIALEKYVYKKTNISAIVVCIIEVVALIFCISRVIYVKECILGYHETYILDSNPNIMYKVKRSALNDSVYLISIKDTIEINNTDSLNLIQK